MIQISSPLVTDNDGTNQPDGVLALLNAAQTGFSRLVLGLATASFPALKRSTTKIAVRLGDDSADAGLTCSTLTASSLVQTVASAAVAGAGLNLPAGVAPTSPVNGDMWYDGTSLFIRLNGVTKTVTVS